MHVSFLYKKNNFILFFFQADEVAFPATSYNFAAVALPFR